MKTRHTSSAGLLLVLTRTVAQASEGFVCDGQVSTDGASRSEVRERCGEPGDYQGSR